MRGRRWFSASLTTRVAVPLVILFFHAGLAKAQTTSVNYYFVVASGFLCDPGDSGDCAAIAKSANGDSYEISGAGTFDTKNKLIKAAGAFSHKSTNGNVLETGVWTAGDLVSFDSYGAATTTQRQKGPAFGRPQIASAKRSPMSPDLLPTGGLAKFRIQLVPLSGIRKTALLQVNCALGEVPRERSVEGIRISFESNHNEFAEELGGRTMFLTMRPDVNAPAKTSQQRLLDSVESPSN